MAAPLIWVIGSFVGGFIDHDLFNDWVESDDEDCNECQNQKPKLLEAGKGKSANISEK